MDALYGLLEGLQVALQPMNLLVVTVGVVLGTAIGLLPGLGPVAAIAVLLPLTFGMDPASAIIMLAGIYYGGMYGGRIPAILLNVPGDESAVVTTMDGYPMTKKGRAGPALGITAIGSFSGGTIALIGMTLFAPIVAQWASRVGPPETVILALAGLFLVSLVSPGSRVKAVIMAVLGLLLAGVGIDMITGDTRLTFGVYELSAGVDVIPLAVGLFGIGEVLFIAEKKVRESETLKKVTGLMPSLEDWRIVRLPILRSAILGFFLGLIPGGGGALSSIVSYGVQKNLSKHPERFGKGAEDGLAATETADNASSNAAFIPLLTLGIPPNAVLALLFGVLMMNNVTPGPTLIEDHPGIFWGVIASMYIGNFLLLILNMPLIGVFVQILKVPPGILYPLIIVIAFGGVYSANNRLFDVYMAAIFGIIGYLLKKFRFNMTPLILAFILGPIIESGFRRTMLMSGGDLGVFFDRPVTVTMIIVIGLIGAWIAFVGYRTKKRAIPQEI